VVNDAAKYSRKRPPIEHFAGVDLHKSISWLAALREPKPASQLRFSNDAVTVEKVLKKLLQGGS
jgi:hypothetical protein